MSYLGRLILPYALSRNNDGTYTVVNRNYKPLGFTDGFYRYEDYPICHRIKSINKRTAKSLSHNNSDDLDMIMLYADDCHPLGNTEDSKDYFERLARLSKYAIKED